eukprot:TRINITY_DN22362_c0_g1_i1.p1 TRINITY_DN22362_c0_g1~~TRINITY_DN22362_c0_g1_i1.p1  ORF type:complete len:383 (+),score=81.52 TRINITY_DN22362_c0_g1_i1:81-1229(+)
MSMHCLADELLLLIFHFLPVKDFRNISICCRRFRSLSRDEPFLRRHPAYRLFDLRNLTWSNREPAFLAQIAPGHFASVGIDDRLFLFGSGSVYALDLETGEGSLVARDPLLRSYGQTATLMSPATDNDGDIRHQRHRVLILGHTCELLLIGDSCPGCTARVLAFNLRLPMFAARYWHSACFDSATDTTFVFGGRGDGTWMEAHYYGDLLSIRITGTSQVVSTIENCTGHAPPPICGHSAVVVGRTMIVWGGANFHDKVIFSYSSELYVLDLDTLEWTKPKQRGPKPVARAFHTAVVGPNDMMFLWGGCKDGFLGAKDCDPDLYMLNPRTWTWRKLRPTGHLPSRRSEHTCAMVGSRLVVFGGRVHDQYSTQLHTLETAAREI